MIIYNPGIKLKNKHLQSLLASSKLRLFKLKNNNPVVSQAQNVLLTTNDAQLQGFYTAAKSKSKEKMFILLHGWEGSAQSTYIQLLANTLFKQHNASIFRLNFRDHGDTHHLNEGLFHSCRLNEVVQAVKQITEKYPHKRVYLCGFSLGGNFCLRVASYAYTQAIKLDKVFAVCPPLVPKKSMQAIHQSRFYSAYFIRKWKKSLIKKQRLFPQIFADSAYKKMHSLNELTKVLVLKHSQYNTTDDYFSGYQITQKVLDAIKIPCHVLASWDDPVIPFEDFALLEKQKNIKLVTSKYGGHCGFINSWKLDSWVEQYILENTQDDNHTTEE